MTTRASRARVAVLDAALLVLCIAVAGAVAIALGQDANWDLQNYHFYDPWALLHGRSLGHDIAAAQLQTYLNPLLDIPFYAMVAADWDPRAIAAALALPAGISAWLLARIAWTLLEAPDMRVTFGGTLAALAIGLTAAMAVGTLGTTMNDWPGVAFTLGATWLLLRNVAVAGAVAIAPRDLVAAGLVVGIGTGLKLTVATFAVGLAIALFLCPPWARPRVRETLRFGLAALAGFAISYGYWGWQLWSHFGNPLFPFANVWIGSPWWEAAPVILRDYGPHTFGGWLEFPLRLREPRTFFVTEMAYTDARISLLYVLAVVAGLGVVLSRISRDADDAMRTSPRLVAAWTFVGVFWATSFLLWTAQYSNLRYIVVLEVLTGVLIVGLLRAMLRPGYREVVVTVVAIALIATTRWPDWWRVDFGPRWFDVKVPSVDPGALVLMVTDTPMAYVLPFLPPDARHLGVTNNFNFPGRRTLIEKTVDATIRAHSGPLYSLASPPGSENPDDLAAHGVRRASGGCALIRTNMRTSPLELCRLARIDPATK